MDRTQVLKASSSMLDLLGVSPGSKEYVEKQMASLLGIQDPNFHKEVYKLWHDAYQKKQTHEHINREVFATEAIVNGLKYVKDERYDKECEKLKSLKVKQTETEKVFKEAVAKATAAQQEYLANRY
jgi:hypothetical protein